MESANKIYQDLIKRTKDSVQAKVRYVFDPETGIQKEFIDGKLVATKQFTPRKKNG